ncbi:hypothetical protein [Streptomyces termitum]|uniref:hypothetical protein n=1 Tax=Streptomyces termitum TaxID=67368 RepID=UPI0033BB9196
MRATTEGTPAGSGGRCEHGLSDEDFRTLLREARSEKRRFFLGRPPPGESDFALRTQHAEFGAAAH